jgi:hypothetical protein
MPERWLLRIVDPEEKASFAYMGTVNWTVALKELAERTELSKGALVEFYKRVQKPKIADRSNAVFEKLFMAAQFLSSVGSIKQNCATGTEGPIATVGWYYALYNAAQAMIYAADPTASTEEHAKTARMWKSTIVDAGLIPRRSIFLYRLL